MDQNQLCELIEELEVKRNSDEIPTELQQGEREILEQVENYDLFLKKSESSEYPINSLAYSASEAFNIEVIQRITKMPKQPAYYEYLVDWRRSFDSLKNIVNALEVKFEPVPQDKLDLMLNHIGQWVTAPCAPGYVGDANEIVKVIEWLQSKGADINFTGRRNGSESVLMLQSCIGHAETVKKLLQLGADPNIRLSSGGTALLFCAGKAFPNKDYLHLNYEERIKSMRLLLQAGAKIITGPKRSDDAKYFASRNTEKGNEGSEKFKMEAMALLKEFND